MLEELGQIDTSVTMIGDSVDPTVLRFDGKRVPHPALVNPRAFYAELSEAYFLGNDHFPFVRAELMNHDREAFERIARLWNPPPAK